MLAYFNDQQIKANILAQLERHRGADELVQGQYWENGKGCAVGCTIHSENHAEYETRFGIPRILAHLEDRIFEGLSDAQAQEWPILFMDAIQPGADLSMVWPRFAHWLCAEFLPPLTKNANAQMAIKGVADLFFRWVGGEKPTTKEWRDAAAYAASASAAAYVATDANRYKAWAAMSEKLIELLRMAPIS